MTRPLFAGLSDAILRKLLVSLRAEGDTVAAHLVREELFYRQPIVVECDYEWTATRGPYDLDDLVGRGNTEREAVDALLELEADARDPEPVDYGMADERARHP